MQSLVLKVSFICLVIFSICFGLELNPGDVDGFYLDISSSGSSHKSNNQFSEIGKNERDRRSFPFSSVQFMNLAHIFADFKFMIVSDCGSYFWPSSVHFLVHLSSHK